MNNVCLKGVPFPFCVWCLCVTTNIKYVLQTHISLNRYQIINNQISCRKINYRRNAQYCNQLRHTTYIIRALTVTSYPYPYIPLFVPLHSYLHLPLFIHFHSLSKITLKNTSTFNGMSNYDNPRIAYMLRLRTSLVIQYPTYHNHAQTG